MTEEESAAWHRAFSKRMRHAREALGISEAEAAAVCFITVRTYRRWEAGFRCYEGAVRLVLFSQRYNVSFNWLVAGTGSGPRYRLRLAAADGKRVA